MLDAICAARRHLVITYTGADPRTGAVVPPAVPLGELLDALDAHGVGAPRRRVRDVVTTRHPLQPFDPRNFDPGALGAPGPFCFDPLALPGRVRPRRPASSGRGVPDRPARRAAAPRRRAGRPGPAAAAPGARVPAAAARISVRLGRGRAGRRAARRAGRAAAVGGRRAGAAPAARRAATPSRCVELEQPRRTLPPGPLGGGVLREVGGRVEALAAACGRPSGSTRRSRSTSTCRCPTATRLTGTVSRGPRRRACCRRRTPRSGRSTGCRPGSTCVALQAARPGRPWRAVAVGRPRRRARRSELQLARADDALAAVAASWSALYRSRSARPAAAPVEDGGRVRRAPGPRRRRRRSRGRGRTRSGWPARSPVSRPTPSTCCCWADGPAHRADRRAALATMKVGTRTRPRGSGSSPGGCGSGCWPSRCCADGRRPAPAARRAGARAVRRCWATCRTARPCSRPAPAPARRSPSPASSPATSPRASPTMDELLVVTFSRESTRELRDRVRERLVSARDGLAAPAQDVDPGDTVLRAPRRRRRRRRGRAGGAGWSMALAAFDAATVTTTHGFCQQVLIGLGTAGDLDAAAAARRGPATTSCPRSPTTCTCASGASHGAASPRRSTVPTSAQLARDVAPRPGHRPRARPRGRRPATPPGCGRGSRAPCATRSTGASGGCACSATTTC